MIKFECEQHFEGVIPKPAPALKFCPDFFRALSSQVDSHPSSGTVKRCIPFKEAMSAGFIIPLWADMYVLASNGDLKIDFPQNFAQPESISEHSYNQVLNHPLSNHPYGKMPLKFINPWIITTEPEVSCLFTSPLNHLESRLKILDGVVDTDNYYNNINFPFLWTGGDGEFLIKKGTPLVQVIPFRREKFTAEYGVIDKDRRDKTTAMLGTKIKDGYRQEFWHKRKETAEE